MHNLEKVKRLLKKLVKSLNPRWTRTVNWAIRDISDYLDQMHDVRQKVQTTMAEIKFIQEEVSTLYFGKKPPIMRALSNAYASAAFVHDFLSPQPEVTEDESPIEFEEDLWDDDTNGDPLKEIEQALDLIKGYVRTDHRSHVRTSIQCNRILRYTRELNRYKQMCDEAPVVDLPCGDGDFVVHIRDKHIIRAGDTVAITSDPLIADCLNRTLVESCEQPVVWTKPEPQQVWPDWYTPHVEDEGWILLFEDEDLVMKGKLMFHLQSFMDNYHGADFTVIDRREQ